MTPQVLRTARHKQETTARQNVFCGVRFDDLDAAATLKRCADITTADKFRFIVTPNVDHVVRLNSYFLFRRRNSEIFFFSFNYGNYLWYLFFNVFSWSGIGQLASLAGEEKRLIRA